MASPVAKILLVLAASMLTDAYYLPGYFAANHGVACSLRLESSDRKAAKVSKQPSTSGSTGAIFAGILGTSMTLSAARRINAWLNEVNLVFGVLF